MSSSRRAVQNHTACERARRGGPQLSSLLLLGMLLVGCIAGERERPIFRQLSSEQTGVTFANTITTTDTLNVQTDVYVYNGAGVAVGDIDNDGLPDIFFAGNMVSSRLYLNKGDMRFEDITARAGVGTTRWATGASMVDIDGDGYLDIYVSVSGRERSNPEDRANLLFLNNRNQTFRDAAAQYAVADTGFTTHAAFLDYDGDGCLDLFLLNNSPTDFSRGEVARHPTGMRGETPGSHNQLYRNGCHGTFTNVSEAAGILRDVGYGLGVAVADLNRDSWPDIYVSNDGTPNDVLYVNNGNGTFTNKAGQWLKHTSFAGMGVDIADINDDGWPDILQVDMLPPDPTRRKRMSGFMTHGNLQESKSRGLRVDYSINALQLSNGVTPDGDIVFSDIAQLAGIAATDWSWSALFADFDNDSRKDVFISNGYPKAVNDFDYQTTMFGIRRRGSGGASERAGLELLGALHSYEEPNYVFRNRGDLTFANVTRQWGMEHRSFSYGAAYADLNNDGRLDLVVSNIDAEAFIYENIAPDGDEHHFLRVTLEGESPNRRGIGATLIATAGEQKQYVYVTPYRGYMSSVDERAHFGLGNVRRVDSLEVFWPDGRYQLLTDVAVDTTLRLKQVDATAKPRPARPEQSDLRFERSVGARGLVHAQRGGTPADYSVQPLLPYMISRHGPALAVGDVDGDGMDDVFVGGGAGDSARLFMQKHDGSFEESTQSEVWTRDRAYDDWGALFFDANGDGMQDLYVASGGYVLAPDSPLLQDRLYINRGGGRFARDTNALPVMLTSTATVRAGDFNGDGKPDLFVGGRLTPRKYPYPTRSYVLRNDGGRFTDVTEDVAPELAHPKGMITSAVWIDFDGDSRLDLVTAGEWMSLEFYRNDGTRLNNVTRATRLPPMRGWWYSLGTGDFDKDGRPDLVAGNLGLNLSFTTTAQSRFGVYAADLTGNQTTDIVLTKEIDGVEYPHFGLVPLGREIYTLGVRFPTHGSFARTSIPQAFGPTQLQRAVHYQSDTFASVYLRNTGAGTFQVSTLPTLAQIAPIRAIVPADLDGDGHLDVLVAGNTFDVEPNTPRADAGNGLWLRGNSRGQFTPVPPGQSGFLAPRNVADLALIDTPHGKTVIVANSGDSLQVFTVRRH